MEPTMAPIVEGERPDWFCVCESCVGAGRHLDRVTVARVVKVIVYGLPRRVSV